MNLDDPELTLNGHYALFTVRSVAERGIAVISCPSDCPSVRPSVMLVDCYHTRWNSSKIISRMISLGT